MTTRKAPVRPWTSAKAAKTAKAPSPTEPAGLEQVLKQANETRYKEKLPPLKLNPILNRVAQEYAELLAKQQNVNAIPGDKNIFDRVKEAGYAFANVSAHFADPREPASADAAGRVLKEPAVAAQLAMPMFVDLGVGIAPGTDGKTYIVLLIALEAKK